jgi:hypothetical protein
MGQLPISDHDFVNVPMVVRAYGGKMSVVWRRGSSGRDTNDLEEIRRNLEAEICLTLERCNRSCSEYGSGHCDPPVPLPPRLIFQM